MVGSTMQVTGLVALAALAGLSTPAEGYGWPARRGYMAPMSPAEALMDQLYGRGDFCEPRGRGYDFGPRDRRQVERGGRRSRDFGRGPAVFEYNVGPNIEALMRLQQQQLYALRQQLQESAMEEQVTMERRRRQWRQQQQQQQQQGATQQGATQQGATQQGATQQEDQQQAAADSQMDVTGKRDTQAASPGVASKQSADATGATPTRESMDEKTPEATAMETTQTETTRLARASAVAPAFGSTRMESTADSLTFTTPVRGLRPEDVKVTVSDGGFLTIEASGKQETGDDTSFFSSTFSFSRAYQLPADVDADSRTTTFTDDKGAFRITFAKVQAPETEASANTETQEGDQTTAAPAEAPKAVPRPPVSDAKSATGPLLEKADDVSPPDVDDDNTDGEWEDM